MTLFEKLLFVAEVTFNLSTVFTSVHFFLGEFELIQNCLKGNNISVVNSRN